MEEHQKNRARKVRDLKRKREEGGEEREKKRAHLDDEIIECEYCGYLIWWNDNCEYCECKCTECGEHPYDCECDEYEYGYTLSFDNENETIQITPVKIKANHKVS